ncbi:rhodanese-like domain-containing protein [Niveibacterium umoris]|uniref:Rhodanese-related sulfurtransferase n=1 Tax=Niveibacterium umoris TaxID=1193620 RepID=A0A840BFI3_9RHOO|nr:MULTISPECIES: rhodanese-like domain-containing protein [Niveibacterium]MBB4011790.1 rhodanese-related sulfurtransferase [Niveibacterium umoris]
MALIATSQTSPLAANGFRATASGSEPSAAAEAILERARAAARDAGLPYAGRVTPQEAWALFSEGAALLVDVRTAEERKFVGHVPETLHVAWMTGTSLIRNPRFVRELESKTGKNAVVLLLCRSGKRSADAAEAAAKAGFANVFNVLEGFEGDLDASQQRGRVGGWRLHGLPWVQD